MYLLFEKTGIGIVAGRSSPPKRQQSSGTLRLFDSVGAGFGALAIVLAAIARDADSTDDFPVADDWNAPFDGYSAFNAEKPKSCAACSEGILEGLGGPLEKSSRACLGNADLGAAQLRVVHFLVINEVARGIHNGHRHGPVIFARLGKRGLCGLWRFQG